MIVKIAVAMIMILVALPLLTATTMQMPLRVLNDEEGGT